MELNLKIHIDDAKYIIAALEQQPYKQVATLITHIRLQAQEQLEKPETGVAKPAPIKAPAAAVTHTGSILPRWVCHKEVWGSNITALLKSDGALTVRTEHGDVDIIDETWPARYKGTDADMGYLVVYQDGYISWSPTKAWENGYERAEQWT